MTDTPLKLVYCIPSLHIPGGMERVLTIKANYFAEVYGYDISIILTDGEGQKTFYELSPKIHIIHLNLNFNQMWDQPFYKKLWIYLKKQRLYKKRLTRCLTEIQPDITISMLRREINFITSIHDGSIKIGEIHVNKDNFRDFAEEGMSGFIKKGLAKIWMWQLKQKLKKLSRFVVLTEEDRVKWSGLDNTAVIHNPLPFYPDQTSDCSKKEVIAVGRYCYQKGFDLLIEAWRIVAEKYPEWNLRIYGGGEQDEYLQLKERYGLTSLYIERQTQEIVNKYCESSIFVLSSRFEGFGMVIAEAMACGLPVVSFACPCGPRDIIHEGKDGFLIKNRNITQMAEKIMYLIEQDDIRKKMGYHARADIERFKIENIAGQWKSLFEKIIR